MSFDKQLFDKFDQLGSDSNFKRSMGQSQEIYNQQFARDYQSNNTNSYLDIYESQRLPDFRNRNSITQKNSWVPDDQLQDSTRRFSTKKQVTPNIKFNYHLDPEQNQQSLVGAYSSNKANQFYESSGANDVGDYNSRDNNQNLKKSHNYGFAQRDQFKPQIPSGFDPTNDDDIDQVNRKIDENGKEIVKLYQRRRELLQAKRSCLEKNYNQEIDATKNQRLDEKRDQLVDIEMQIGQYTLDEIIRKNECFVKMPTFVSMIAQQHQQPSKDFFVEKKLQDFWDYNRKAEKEIDMELKNLQKIEQSLETLNEEIQENCQNLDRAEEKIRELLAAKNNKEAMAKAEPFNAMKKKIHEELEQKLFQRNHVNDDKIDQIQLVLQQLQELKEVRKQRVEMLHELFDDKGNMNFQTRIKFMIGVVEQLESMIAMKKNFNGLCTEEQDTLEKIDQTQKQIDKMQQNFIEKLNEQARQYRQLSDIQNERVQINKVVEFMAQQGQVPSTTEEDLRSFLQFFKEKCQFFKQFIEEDYKIIEGLKKTELTIVHLDELNESIKIEQNRRQNVYKNLENVMKLKLDENDKCENLRNLEVEITKKTRQKAHIEEDLEYMKNEADLETFKKIGNVFNVHDEALKQLCQERQYQIREIEKLNQNIYKKISSVTDEYQDILQEIFPNDWNSRLDLKKLQDINFLKNTMFHTFKRLGIKDQQLQ